MSALESLLPIPAGILTGLAFSCAQLLCQLMRKRGKLYLVTLLFPLSTQHLEIEEGHAEETHLLKGPCWMIKTLPAVDLQEVSMQPEKVHMATSLLLNFHPPTESQTFLHFCFSCPQSLPIKVSIPHLYIGYSIQCTQPVEKICFSAKMCLKSSGKHLLWNRTL